MLTLIGLEMVTVSMVVTGAIFPSAGLLDRIELKKALLWVNVLVIWLVQEKVH
jgi:hypothetical protein